MGKQQFKEYELHRNGEPIKEIVFSKYDALDALEHNLMYTNEQWQLFEVTRLWKGLKELKREEIFLPPHQQRYVEQSRKEAERWKS